jgi:transposase
MRDGSRDRSFARAPKQVIRDKATSHVFYISCLLLPADRKAASARRFIAVADAIEHICWRLKNYRRIATRYAKLATKFISAAHPAATVTY